MAFTETYVAFGGAGAHDGSSEANAWSFAEMLSAAPAAGTRVNIKYSPSYTSGAANMPSNGTISAPIVLRGYSSTIGDLDGQGRSSTGALNTTNFPVFTLSGALSPRSYCHFQNLNITGAISSALISNVNTDGFAVISCALTNTQNNASAACVLGDNSIYLLNSDFYCSGAAHDTVVDTDIASLAVGCRFRGTSAAVLFAMDAGEVTLCSFRGNSSAIGIQVNTSPSQSSPSTLIQQCTFYGIGTGVTFPNLSLNTIAILVNNHVTDCAKWLDNLYSATATMTVIEANNRLRDVTTPRTGIEPIKFGEVTTDTGGAETDYEDAANGDFRLISGAAGRGIGLPINIDAGAYQHLDSGGGLLLPSGFNGGYDG